jgi:hypothetical protein
MAAELDDSVWVSESCLAPVHLVTWALERFFDLSFRRFRPCRRSSFWREAVKSSRAQSPRSQPLELCYRRPPPARATHDAAVSHPAAKLSRR